MARHTFFCIDAHTCGNPVRVVAGGGPLLPAVSMAEKRQIFVRDYDWIRRALMFFGRTFNCTACREPGCAWLIARLAWMDRKTALGL